MRFVSAVFLAGLLALSAQAQTELYPGLQGDALLSAIRSDYTPNQTLGYGPARDVLWAYTDDADGELCGVYTGFCIQLTPGADPSSDAFSKGLNAEHTWPQSLGAGDEPRRSDMHNLFPTRVQVNSDRGNDPFGEIADASAQRWYRGSVIQSGVPTTDLDEWSEDTSSRFEPREDHKGNAARAVFYFYAIYDSAISGSGDSFFAVMLGDLLAWNEANDPADDRERARNAFIATRQGNENPFILDPTLARRAFAPATVDAERGPGGLTVSVFPNPTAGHVVVSLNDARDVQVEVVDALGRRVRSAVGAGRQTLDLGGLPVGLYLVRVTTEAGTVTRPVSVLR